MLRIVSLQDQNERVKVRVHARRYVCVLQKLPETRRGEHTVQQVEVFSPVDAPAVRRATVLRTVSLPLEDERRTMRVSQRRNLLAIETKRFIRR